MLTTVVDTAHADRPVAVRLEGPRHYVGHFLVHAPYEAANVEDVEFSAWPPLSAR